MNFTSTAHRIFDVRGQATRQCLVVAAGALFIAEVWWLAYWVKLIRSGWLVFVAIVAGVILFMGLIGWLSRFAANFAKDAFAPKPTRSLDEREIMIRYRAEAGAYRFLSLGLYFLLVALAFLSDIKERFPDSSTFWILWLCYSLNRQDLPLLVLAWTEPDIVEIEEREKTGPH